MQGIEVDASRLAEVPSLVIGASYEYVPSGSHFGLVMGSGTWPQVAQSVFGWLEERRHAMAAATAALAGAGARR